MNTTAAARDAASQAVAVAACAVSLFQPNAHMLERAKRKRAAEVVVFSIVVVQFVLGAGERKDLSPYLFLTRRVLPSNARQT